MSQPPTHQNEELFDLSAEYESMLNQGIRLSGENREFFIEGRIQGFRSVAPAGFAPKRILDYGCGIGTTAKRLAEEFPGASVVGVDTSQNALDWATANYGSDRIRFAPLNALAQETPDFDLCYVNGVFHHIPLDARLGAAAGIQKALRKGGLLALFENNPWNPGARMVMSRIPFDRDAIMLTPSETAALVRKAGLTPVMGTKSFFYFPRQLSPLRPAEAWLKHLPLGAQYLVLAAKA